MSQPHFTLEHISNQDNSLKEAYSQALKQLFSGGSAWKQVKKNSRNIIAFHPDMGVYFKSFNRSPVTERLKSTFTGGRAKRTLAGTRLLQETDCMAPKILATGHYPGHDFIIMEALEGAPLLNAIESYLRDSPDSQWRKDLFRELGLTIGKMHANGIIHGDLRGNNVVIVPDHQRYRLAMIDNERTRKAFRFNREQQRNLKQIMLFGPCYITPDERDLFFDCYFQAFPHPKQRAAQLKEKTFTEVEKHFQRKGVVQGTPLESVNYWPILKTLSPFELSAQSPQ